MVKNSGSRSAPLTLSSVTCTPPCPGWALLVLAVGHVPPPPRSSSPRLRHDGLAARPARAAPARRPAAATTRRASSCRRRSSARCSSSGVSGRPCSWSASPRSPPDLRARKQWWKVLFNPAQYAVSVGAAYLAIRAVHGAIGLDNSLPRLDVDALLWIPLAWVVYYVVNWFIVCCVLSYTGPLKALLMDDFVHVSLMTFAVMAISPISSSSRCSRGSSCRCCSSPCCCSTTPPRSRSPASNAASRRPHRPAQPQDAALRARQRAGALRAGGHRSG